MAEGSDEGMLERAEGTKIKWKPSKDVTVKVAIRQHCYKVIKCHSCLQLASHMGTGAEEEAEARPWRAHRAPYHETGEGG